MIVLDNRPATTPTGQINQSSINSLNILMYETATATRKCFAAPCRLVWWVVQRGQSPYIPASSF